MTILDFLTHVWQDKPDDQLHPHLDPAEQAVPLVHPRCGCRRYVASVSGSMDVYVGVGLAGKDYGPALRCASDEVTGILRASPPILTCSPTLTRARTCPRRLSRR